MSSYDPDIEQDEDTVPESSSAAPFVLYDRQEQPSQSLRELADQYRGDGRCPRFKLVSASEWIATHKSDWIIKGVLPKAELGVIYGEPGAGKSFFALDLACAVALGESWRGLRTRGGKVVYLCGEGGAGIADRITALAIHRGRDAVPIALARPNPSFRLERDVQELADVIKLAGGASLIFVDTLARFTAGCDENSGKEMGTVIDHCRLLHERTGALVMLIHHSGKNDWKGARGWSGLKAAADVEIKITRAPQGGVARISKLKDGADGREFGFSYRTIVVRQDEDGANVDSLVLEAVGVATQACPIPNGGKWQKLVLSTHAELSTERNWGSVRRNELTAAAEQAVAGHPEWPRPAEQIERAIKRLIEKNVLGEEGDCVALATGDTIDIDEDPDLHAMPEGGQTKPV